MYKQGELVIFGLENFTSVFQKQGGNLNFEKNVIFLEFFGFTLCFRTFQAKKIGISSEKVQGPKFFCYGMHFEVLSTKYVKINNFRQFFKKIATKFLIF